MTALGLNPVVLQVRTGGRVLSSQLNDNKLLCPVCNCRVSHRLPAVRWSGTRHIDFTLALENASEAFNSNQTPQD